MSRDRLLALDLGTTGVRALLVDVDGSVCTRAYRPLSTHYPRPGWVEQDPMEMWVRSQEVIAEVLGATPEGARDIVALGVVNQRATVIAWDGDTGDSLAPAISWQDHRTAERVARFRDMGIPLNTLASATKFEWWLQSNQNVREAASAGRLRFGTPDSWLTFCLTGGTAHVTDPGNASATALYDVSAGVWAEPLLKLFGIPAAVMPEVVATSAIVGETSIGRLGTRIPVAARAGDQQASAFAQGVHRAGEAKLTLGTSGMLDLHTGSAVQSIQSGVYPLALWHLSDGTRAFCLEGTVITAGAVLDWLVQLGLGADPAAIDHLAGEVSSADGVVFVPALEGLGTPFLDDRATGLLTGLSRGSGRAHIARAVLEGIAQRCVDVCEALGVDSESLPIDGGLARSGVLLQAIADLGGREVRRAAEMETTAVGAAYLAGLAVGVFKEPEACPIHAHAGRRFEPRGSSEERAEKRHRWTEVLRRVRNTD